MNNKNRYRELMERIRELHQEFTDVWTRVRTAELLKAGLNPSTLTYMDNRHLHANAAVYEAARPQTERINETLRALFDALPFERFLQGKPDAIDAMLDFLEIDILAFRCGYQKEWCCQKLKPLPLNPNQKQRLCRLAIDLCRGMGQRRELRDLARLMIKNADRALVQELTGLADNGVTTFTATHNFYTKQKARRVLNVILNGRPDLRHQVGGNNASDNNLSYS